jgi:hypothetical protein
MSLDTWRDISDPTTRVVALIGDSTTERGWYSYFRDIAKPRWGYGGYGVVHPGKYRPGDAFGNYIEQWTQSGSWTHGGNSDLWNIGFTSQGASALCGTWHANGSTNTMTWTKPIDCPAVTGFKLLTCDGTGASNYSYQIDGGSWTNVSATWSNANALQVITINSAVTSTVSVRAANAAGTATDLYVVGIEPLCSSTGLKVHAIAASGGFLNLCVRDAGVAQWQAWFLYEQPDVCVIKFVNDAAFWNDTLAAQYQTRLDEFGAMVTGYGGIVVYYSYFDWNGPSEQTQADMRARELAIAQKYGGYYYDLNALSGGSHAAEVAAGIFVSDGTHPSDYGSRLMANHCWNILGRKLYADKLVRT